MENIRKSLSLLLVFAMLIIVAAMCVYLIVDNSLRLSALGNSADSLSAALDDKGAMNMPIGGLKALIEKHGCADLDALTPRDKVSFKLSYQSRTHHYDEELKKLFYYSSGPSSIFDIARLNAQHPIECIELLGDDDAYVVYKIQNADSQQYYTCMFLKRKIIFDTEVMGLSEVWEPTPQLYTVSRHVSSSDFENIVPGSTIDDVAKTDPAARYDILESNDNTSHTSYRLLTDGVMVIKYDISCEDDYIVSSKEFFAFDDADAAKELMPYVDISLLSRIE